MFDKSVFVFREESEVDSLPFEKKKRKEGRKIWRAVQIFLLLYTSMVLLLKVQKKVWHLYVMSQFILGFPKLYHLQNLRLYFVRPETSSFDDRPVVLTSS